jgi:hypothetical protein
MFSLSSLINDSLIFQPSQSGQASNIRNKISDFRNKWWEHVEGMKEIFSPERGLDLLDDRRK